MPRQPLRVCDWPWGATKKRDLLQVLLRVDSDGAVPRVERTIRDLSREADIGDFWTRRLVREMVELRILVRVEDRAGERFVVGGDEELVEAMARLAVVTHRLPVDPLHSESSPA